MLSRMHNTIRMASTTAKTAAATPKALTSIAPFHLAIPVHNLAKAKEFYGNTLGFPEGRSAATWQDYNMMGHQLVCHEVKSNYQHIDYTNPVDNDDVPVMHFGVALNSVDDFHALANRCKDHGVKFVIEPHLRFKGMPGEQWTMFFKDPSNNNLEFKAMTNPGNLFTKYYVEH